MRTYFKMSVGKPTNNYLRYLLLAFIILASTYSYAQQVVQIKVFSESLEPYGNISISINSQKFIEIPSSAIAYANLSDKEFPINSISIKNENLEVATWNFSKGILEMTIREKSYVDTRISLEDIDGKPLKNVKVYFNGLKDVSTQTNSEGTIILPLGKNEKITLAEQFQVPGYVIERLSTTKPYQLILKKKEEKLNEPIELISKGQNEKDWNEFVLQNINQIDSLDQFYEFIKQIPRTKLNRDTDQLLDQKYKELLNDLKSSVTVDTNSFLQNITNDTYLDRDLDQLLKEARKDGEVLSKQRIAFEEKIQLVRDKLNAGFENLNEEEKDELLQDINLLEKVLLSNKNEFNDNQESYQAILTELKRRFFDLKKLEKRLSQSEEERLKEKKKYQSRMLAILGVVLVFALLIILLFYLRSRLQKQQKQLINANRSVQTMNENLETLVSERTALLEQTYKELDLVLYRASHDLRAPICSIAGLSDLISRQTGNSELTDLVLKTNRQMDRLLKKLSTISEIHHPGVFENLNLYTITQSVLAKLQDRIKRYDISVKLNCPKDLEVKSIAFLTETIIYNIVENAINFRSSSSNKDKEIAIDISKDDQEVIIQITDNGIGIEKAVMGNVYDMFFIGTENSNGNGLGLYIVEKAVTVLKGRVSISSERNTFTKVVVNLPVDDSKGHALDFINQ